MLIGRSFTGGKKGISAVIATVLIILIVVVGIGIVWTVILPLFEELEFLSYSDIQLNIVKSGYTVYDSDKHFAFVQIERGSDEVNMTGIEIGFIFEGTSKTYQSSKVPQPGGKYTYKFNFTKDEDYGVPQNEAPSKVTVAPIFTLNNKIRLGKNLDEEDLPSGTIYLSDPEWEKVKDEAAENIVVVHIGRGDSPGVQDDDDQGEDDDGPDDPEPVIFTYYLDSDGDGYSNGTISAEYEEDTQPSEYVLDTGDCNDFDDLINPGALEVSNNYFDEDCNGLRGVDGCFEIREAGDYELMGNLDYLSSDIMEFRIYDLDYPGYVTDKWACLLLNGSDINFDLNGNDITCGDSCGSASIFVFNGENVNVSNGNISTDSYSGITTYNSANVLLEDLDIHDTGYLGIDFHITNDSIIRNVNLIDNPTMGLKIWKSYNNLYEDNVFCGSALWNIYCNEADDNTGTNNMFSGEHTWECLGFDLDKTECS